MLPPNPLFVGAVRALGGAIPLLLISREIPAVAFYGKLVLLGTLNAGLFFGLLFIAVSRLSGGAAGSVQALFPLFIMLLAWFVLGERLTTAKITGVALSTFGLALIIGEGSGSLDPIGIAAAVGGTFSLALGVILINKWGCPISMTGFTGWQLAIGGIELAILALVFHDIPAAVSDTNVLGLVVLAVVITSVPFFFWFHATSQLGAVAIAPFTLLIAIKAFVWDVAISQKIPTILQASGIVLIVTVILLNPPAIKRNRSRHNG
ncbi:EamA family transporter [Bradyrhizobium sp. Ash2021]|uniref:DMT family transporter n=1 Tax=Bradyrhizobium sp. Ash2021 TaxID=2954771 RepID=UPI00281524C4|nr:EamA family transporter [Bradyrhizobium sp. Ash2021]WMT76464.1 DMT family transporter [Bradyrhizobium sp. Ash2021]